jgi:hypothetical protein
MERDDVDSYQARALEQKMSALDSLGQEQTSLLFDCLNWKRPEVVTVGLGAVMGKRV